MPWTKMKGMVSSRLISKLPLVSIYKNKKNEFMFKKTFNIIKWKLGIKCHQTINLLNKNQVMNS